MLHTTLSNSSRVMKLMMIWAAQQPIRRTCKYAFSVHPPNRMAVTSCVTRYVDSRVYRGARGWSTSDVGYILSLSIICSRWKQCLLSIHTLSLYSSDHCELNSFTMCICPRTRQPYNNIHFKFIKRNQSSMMKSLHEHIESP